MGSEFYLSEAWLHVRYKVLDKYGRRCMACYATNKEIHVDHIKPRSKFPELELTFDNLQVLCRACNIGKWNLSEKDWREGAEPFKKKSPSKKASKKRWNKKNKSLKRLQAFALEQKESLKPKIILRKSSQG